MGGMPGTGGSGPRPGILNFISSLLYIYSMPKFIQSINIQLDIKKTGPFLTLSFGKYIGRLYYKKKLSLKTFIRTSKLKSTWAI